MTSKLAQEIVVALEQEEPIGASGYIGSDGSAKVVDRILREHKIPLRPMNELPYNGQILVFWKGRRFVRVHALDGNTCKGDTPDIGWLPLDAFDLPKGGRR